VFHQVNVPAEVARRQVEEQDHGLARALDIKLIEKCKPAIERGEKVQFMEEVRNVNRTVGAMLSGELVRHHPEGLPDQTIFMQMEGTGGQSFGAFLAKGITIYLIGDANDYTGKGLSGGRITIRPSIDFRGDATSNIIVGNTVLYGATSGEAFFRGVAGERFAVRLSGATAVVEGTGDHGCEYMTGGTVVVLGKTGRNFAAGMSGGVAYILDESGSFSTRCNQQMVGIEKFEDAAEAESVRQMIQRHCELTQSQRAAKILSLWAKYSPMFVKVMPQDHKRMLQCIKKATEQGLTGEEAMNAAFQENTRSLARVGGG